MQETNKVEALATPYSHTQVEMTDVVVSTILITAEGRAEVAQHHFVFFWLGLVSSSLCHDPWDGVLLYSMGSENSTEELRCRKVWGGMAKLNYKHILEFQVHVFNMQKVQVGFVSGHSAMVNEHLGRQLQHNQIKNVF